VLTLEVSAPYPWRTCSKVLTFTHKMWRQCSRSMCTQACADREHCSRALLAAGTAIRDAVFSGSLDRLLGAYSSETGKKSNGSQHGPRLRNRQWRSRSRWFSEWAGCGCLGGIAYVNSGYIRFGEAPGNVLLAFSADGP
jgi:polyvinyl alcohol dehydrogenase (cytochrome)